MATKSILKTVTIRNKNLARNFVSALEYSIKQKNKKKHNSNVIEIKDLSGTEVKDLFGETNA